MPGKIIRVWAKCETCLIHEANHITLSFTMREGRGIVAKDAQRQKPPAAKGGL